MEYTIQVGEQFFTPSDLIPLLKRYQLLPQLHQELILDRAISNFQCTSEETVMACQQFEIDYQLTSQKARQAFCDFHGLSIEELEILATRQLRIEKFKQATWSNKLESYFLKRKSQLDQVIYSLIRTRDGAVAQELYFRLQEQEQSFPELARQYSQGPEAKVCGIIGPTELGNPHPQIVRMLSVSKPGQLWPPYNIGKWFVIVRLEEFIPAQLDEPMRRRLLQELFTNWLTEQLNQGLQQLN